MSDFDERAATWDDDPAKWVRACTVAEAIGAALPLDGTQRMLEYGAGTGLVTQALQADVGPVTLADASEGMRDVMRAKIAAGVLDTGARVLDLDLETEPPAPDDRFDLVVTVMTLHHVGRVDLVLSRFAEMLDANGALCVVDLDAEDGSFHGPDADVHQGFERSEIRTALAVAGFSEIEIGSCHQMVRDDVTFTLFLATCRKPAD